MLKCHKHHKKLASLYNSQEEKTVEGRKKIKLDVYRYEDATERHQQVVFSDKIEKTILNLPEEEYEEKKISSGNV